jgi:hypothetical protein
VLRRLAARRQEMLYNAPRRAGLLDHLLDDAFAEYLDPPLTGASAPGSPDRRTPRRSSVINNYHEAASIVRPPGSPATGSDSATRFEHQREPPAPLGHTFMRARSNTMPMTQHHWHHSPSLVAGTSAAPLSAVRSSALPRGFTYHREEAADPGPYRSPAQSFTGAELRREDRSSSGSGPSFEAFRSPRIELDDDEHIDAASWLPSRALRSAAAAMAGKLAPAVDLTSPLHSFHTASAPHPSGAFGTGIAAPGTAAMVSIAEAQVAAARSFALSGSPSGTRLPPPAVERQLGTTPAGSPLGVGVRRGLVPAGAVPLVNPYASGPDSMIAGGRRLSQANGTHVAAGAVGMRALVPPRLVSPPPWSGANPVTAAAFLMNTAAISARVGINFDLVAPPGSSGGTSVSPAGSPTHAPGGSMAGAAASPGAGGADRVTLANRMAHDLATLDAVEGSGLSHGLSRHRRRVSL